MGNLNNNLLTVLYYFIRVPKIKIKLTISHVMASEIEKIYF